MGIYSQESVAFHVPTITTDLAGFGLWVNSLKNQHGINDGVEVLHRSDYNYSEVRMVSKDTITLFADKSEKEIKEIRKRAAEVAEQALWKHFIQYYYEAYDIAFVQCDEASVELRKNYSSISK